ncbi:MAG: hypothetical protein ABIF18_04410 [archaeon]
MLKLYNTLTRKKEKFVPIKKGKVGIYTCGPTVYWFDAKRKIYKSLSTFNDSNLWIVNMLPGDLMVAGCFFSDELGGFC